MKLCDILSGVECSDVHADLQSEITGVYYDSRAVKPGGLFVAIKGFETDGHEYINAARKNGAAVILCERAPEGEDYILTKDTRRALALASKNFFSDPAAGLKLIGVTGTNGKTTTTMLLKHVLESQGEKVGLIGTNQNMIGEKVLPTERTTPESFELQKLFREMADEGCTCIVMEVSSHSLALERVAGLRFAAGVFTNLTQDHLDFHGTMEEYARCKALLFSQCDKAAVNLDDPWAEYMINHAECPLISFSVNDKKADLMASELSLSARGVNFSAAAQGKTRSVELGIPGRFSVYNALAVMAACMVLDVDLDACVKSLASAEGVKGRVEVVPTDGDYTILIDYAHTPDALENVLKSVKEVAEGRVVALFGCGGDRDRTKRPIMGHIATQNADVVIVTSDNPRTEEPSAIISDICEGIKDSKVPVEVLEDRREAIHWAIDNHLPGDVIVLAGKGHETYQIIGKTKHHMDEREIVAEYLEMRKKI